MVRRMSSDPRRQLPNDDIHLFPSANSLASLIKDALIVGLQDFRYTTLVFKLSIHDNLLHVRARLKKRLTPEARTGCPTYRNQPLHGSVTLAKAPNGVIANKKLLDRIGDFSWLNPTIENPPKGI